MDSYDMAVKKTASELGISVGTIRKCYHEFWKFIRDSIEELPLSDEFVTEDEFKKMCTVFNIPSLCKLYCTYGEYVKKKESIQKRQRRRNAKNKERTPDVLGSPCDDGQV